MRKREYRIQRYYASDKQNVEMFYLQEHVKYFFTRWVTIKRFKSKEHAEALQNLLEDKTDYDANKYGLGYFLKERKNEIKKK